MKIEAIGRTRWMEDKKGGGERNEKNKKKE